MPNLKFNQLLLISNSTKSANLFEFQEHLNLITADDNSVGKSTLVKLLFWGMGCDTVTDTTWKNMDCKTIVRFSVGEDQYEIMRYKDILYITQGNQSTMYPKITGDFAERMAKILGFDALLPNRGKDKMEVPPPAYYFVPFYIDQKQSWSTAWNNFEGLGQYDGWKPIIIKYHVGLLPPRHFEIEKDKMALFNEKKSVTGEIEKISSAIQVVNDYIPRITATISQDKLQKMTDEIRIDLKKLSDEQEDALEKLSKLESDRAFLYHQKAISEQIVKDLDKDYVFAIENIEGDQVACPLCGTYHENNILTRTSILTDKQQAKNQLDEITSSLADIEKKVIRNREAFEKITNSIARIHDKYYIEDEETRTGLNEIIENVAGNSIRDNVIEARNGKVLKVSSITADINSLKTEQSNLLTKEDREKINNDFITTFASYVQILDAEGINLSEIKSPLEYNKVVKEGGAAEGTRGILAYYLSIFSMIAKHGNEVLAPMVIDTPNQHEQSITNYDKILKLITEKLPQSSQIFICAMDSERLQPIKEKAKIIKLDKNKLLIDKMYDIVKPAFQLYFDAQNLFDGDNTI